MTLDYKIRSPKTILDKNPLLLLLHGYGSNEEDLFSFASELPAEYFVVSAQAPYPLMQGAYAWYAINFDADENKFSDIGQARQSREMIMRFLEELTAKYPIDGEDITLIGFSQGAILSYATALSYPEHIRRVVAMSGYVNLDIAIDDFENQEFSNLKIFASHGTVDQVIPVDWARKAPETLKNFGIPITYKEYNVGHGVAPQNFFDFRQWLLDTKKN